MNLLSLWFQHPRGDLCWRRVLTVAVNVSMLAWVESAIAGLIDGAILVRVVGDCRPQCRSWGVSSPLARFRSVEGSCNV